MPNLHSKRQLATLALQKCGPTELHPIGPDEPYNPTRDAVEAIAAYTRETLLTQIVNLSPESVHAIALEYAKMTGKPPAPTRYQKPKPLPNQKELPIDDP